MQTLINKSKYRILLDEIMLGTMLLLLCFQNLVVHNFGDFGLKYNHLFFLFFFLYVVAKKGLSLTILPTTINIPFLLVFALTAINISRWGLNSVILNYSYMYLLILVVYNITSTMEMQRIDDVIQGIAWIVLFFILAKIAVNINQIVVFFANPWNGHPAVKTYFGGGVNLEASWIALFGTIFHPNQRGAVYLSLALMISILYASRVSMVICIAVILYVFGLKGMNKKFVLKTLFVIVGIIAVIAALYAIDSPIIGRLLSIGEDRGSEGRLRMWRYAWPAFMQSPLIGSGAGSSTNVVRMISGLYYTEDNIHNYYMQVAIDFGVLGFLCLAFLLLRLVVKIKHYGFDNPYAVYILIYLIAAFIQFRGGEPLTGFMLGCYFTYETQRAKALRRAA